MKKIIFMLLILSTVVCAQGVNDYNDVSSLVMDFELSSNFEFTPISNNPLFQFVGANITLFPRETISQKIISSSIITDQDSIKEKYDDNIFISWNNQKSNSFNYKFKYEVKSSNVLNAIDEKVKFPITYIDTQYTRATGKIDITPEIRENAQKIAAGEDDLYIVVYKIGDWVEKNIKYDLSTLTAEIVQPSSWVLKNKQGVCDELTNLFISMVRSLGIPARYVSGMAYTNTLNDWGPHAWAEVYFPDKGWVPFDVTYGQLGWVDPTHIPLKYSLDSGEPSVQYTWKSRDLDLKSDEVKLNTDLKSDSRKIDPLVYFEVKPLFTNVGPGSYVPFEVTIKNLFEYYLPNTIIVTKANELTTKNYERILLKPYEEKKLYWITKLPEEAQRGYIYTTLIEVEDFFHTTSSSNITYSAKYPIIDLQSASAEVNKLSIKEEKVFSEDLGLDCSAQTHVYTYEKLEILCYLYNRGTVQLKDLKVCLEKDCYDSELDIGGRKELTFSLSNLQAGIHNFEVKVNNNRVFTKDLVSVSVIESPDLQITEINYPNNIDYDQDFKFDMLLEVLRPIKEVSLSINNNKLLEISELKDSKKIVIHSSGDNFAYKNINVHINYKDENGKSYSFDKTYNIEVHNIPWYAKLINYLRILF